MAAKQGTLAQLSAQAEDAKRAVLSKAVPSSWFSNLNTVCTIKSAPPRSPEVLQLLATKSGWLYKRNEQHVWQARWCCVVPHTFLYYFDAPAGTITGSNNNNSHCPNNALPGPAQQEEWNHAVQYGLGDRKPHEKRSHFPLFHGSTTTSAPPTTTNSTLDDDNDNFNSSSTLPNGQNLPPAGIIDLECYTTMHRSSENELVIQLAGDDQVNPDLRAFYFCCDGNNPKEVDEWSHAILNNRHSSLQDEVDAFKYVADSFAERLDLLYAELNESKAQQEENEQVLYRVRSAAEGTCRTVYRIVEECWDRTLPDTTNTTTVPLSNTEMDVNLSINEKRIEFRQNLETIRQQDLGIPASVRLMGDYVAAVEDMCVSLQNTVKQLQSDVQKSDQIDQAEIVELQAEYKTALKQHQLEKEQLIQELTAVRAENQSTNKELKDVQKDLSSTKMEITMLLSQQRTKNTTLLQIKKKLKNEVLDLRQKLAEVGNEKSTIQHENDKLKLQLEQERANNEMLKKFMAKVESQIQVQQNMMEMMSQAGGGGSVYGGGGSVYGGGGSVYGGGGNAIMNGSRSIGHASYRMDRHPAASSNKDDEDGDFNIDENDVNDDEHDVIDEDFENDERMLLQPPNIPMSPPISGGRRSRRMPHAHGVYRRSNSNNFMSDHDIDNKSHVSELTEDRTQRELTAFQNHHLLSHHQQSYSPLGAYRSDVFQSDARTRKRLQETALTLTGSPRPIISGPPAVIVGVKKSSESSASNHNLDTINNSTGSVRSLPVVGNNASATPPLYRNSKNITGSESGVTGRTESASVLSGDPSITESGTSTAKISVAQLARMEADKKTTPVRVRLDEKSLSSLQQQRSEANLKALANIGVIPNNSTATTPARVNTTSTKGKTNQEQDRNHSSPQHSHQGSGLWRRVEEAVLGPRSDDDDEDDSDSYDSEGSTRITDMTEANADTNADNAKRRFGSSSQRHHPEEKKSTDSVVSLSNLSLQERSMIQREKQIQFLREQGLMKYAQDMKGGAGAVLTSNTDTASVTSSNGGGAHSTTGSSVINRFIPPRKL